VRWSKLGPRTIAVGREDGVVELIACVHNADDAGGNPQRGKTRGGGVRFERLATLRGHTAAITDIDWTLSGGDLVTSSLDGDVRLWRGAVQLLIFSHPHSLQSAWFQPLNLLSDIPGSKVLFFFLQMQLVSLHCGPTPPPTATTGVRGDACGRSHAAAG
jgi:WD40 repeat protein